MTRDEKVLQAEDELMSENSKETDKQALERRGCYECESYSNLKKHEHGDSRSNKHRSKYHAGRSQVVHIASQNRRLAKMQPDLVEPCITGRYQEVRGNFTFLINQAGIHIECWKSEEIPDRYREKEVRMLSGDREGTKYMLHTYGDPKDKQGTLDFSDQNNLVWNDGKAQHFLCLIEKRATYSEQAIDCIAGTGDNFLKAFEHLPLTNEQLDLLRDRVLSEKEINKIITEKIRETGVGGSYYGSIQLPRELDERIGFIKGSIRSWNEEFLIPFYARQTLAVRIFEKRTQLNWIELMVNDYYNNISRYRVTSSLSNIHEYLNLLPLTIKHTLPIEYTFRMIVWGFSAKILAGFGGFYGQLSISRKDWGKEEDFSFFYFSSSFGPESGLEVGSIGTASAETYEDWAPEDFPGMFSIGEISVKGKAVGGGKLSKGMMLIHGNNRHPTMAVDVSGKSLVAGLGLGIGYGKSFGYIREGTRSIYNNAEPSDILPGNFDYSAKQELKKKIHFRRGDALLTNEGRQALRVMAAKELACFTTPYNYVLIDAHADRVDTDERNLELSNLRAENTKQALKDILRQQLNIRPDNIITRGHGERHAAVAGDKDGQDNPNWRRVDVILDHRLVLRMTGQ